MSYILQFDWMGLEIDEGTVYIDDQVKKTLRI